MLWTGLRGAVRGEKQGGRGSVVIGNGVRFGYTSCQRAPLCVRRKQTHTHTNTHIHIHIHTRVERGHSLAQLGDHFVVQRLASLRRQVDEVAVRVVLDHGRGLPQRRL